MKLLLIIPLVLILAGPRAFGSGAELEDSMTNDGKTPNHLINEKSPYLQQHAYNPVDWYPWGEEAFKKARDEDKPILLSIGYSTCHWCHVMEEESFSDPETAAVMNRHFVNIKVDREERPDIDKIYMTAVSALTGSGGWPLNVFLTPDLRPFFGGTYFPPFKKPGMLGWTDLLGLLADAWRDPAKREKVLSSADEVTAAVTRFLSTSPGAGETADIGPGLFKAARKTFESGFDDKLGGFSGAPKFPSPSIQNFLLLDHIAGSRNGDTPEGSPPSLNMVFVTLQAMATGGIYDQIGGGFHRYATDAKWHVPHFEKMLYDNAQLVFNYVDAFRVSGDRSFLKIAEETADYILRDMTHPTGGFYSAEDADSLPPGRTDGEKSEGAFYTWSMKEVEALLGEQTAEIFAFRYGMVPGGNAASDPFGEFIGKNILFVAKSIRETSKRFDLSDEDLLERLADAKQKLFEARNRRPRPHLDDKILTAWNGLMISAFSKLYQARGGEKYLNAAQKAASFLQENLYDANNRQLFRRWRNGERKIGGMASDYAFLTQGLIDLYEADFDPRWLDWAFDLAEETLAAFYDSGTGGVFMTRAGHDRSLILRAKESTDNVVPSAASVTVLNLLRLSRFSNRTGFSKAARHIMKATLSDVKKNPAAAPQMLVALGYDMAEPVQVIIAGNAVSNTTREMLAISREALIPGKIVMLVGGDRHRKSLAKHLPFVENVEPIQGKPAAYVCVGTLCKEPVTQPRALRMLLHAYQKPVTGLSG